MRNFVWISCALFAACGDNNDGKNVDAGPDIDSPIADAAVDTPIDSPDSTFTPPPPYGPPISPNGPDQIQAVKAGPNGSWYLAGFAAQTPTGPKGIFVAKTTATGPDIAFGNVPNAGVAALAAVTPTGGADEIDLAVQSDGKILVSYNVTNAGDATDRDVQVARLNTNGTLDTSFGTDGFATIDFSTKNTTGTAVLDTARGLAVDANNNVFVTAVALSPTGATPNSDFAMAKLTADGTLCDGTNGTTGWGRNDSGKFFLDTQVGGMSMPATVRGVVALADGSVIAGGYVGGSGLAAGNVPVWYKLDANGDLETEFGGAGTGYFFDAVLTRQTEVYNFALNAAGTKVTTGGYGNVLGVDRDDWISMQIDTTTGALTKPWGGAADGAKLIDVSPNMTSSNCRNAVALPGGKTLMIGSTGQGNMAVQDAVFAIIDENGNLDTHYGPGIHRFKFTSADDKNDQFWGAAVSGTKVLVAGWRGTAGAAQDATLNDNSFLVIFDLQQ